MKVEVSLSRLVVWFVPNVGPNPEVCLGLINFAMAKNGGSQHKTAYLNIVHVCAVVVTKNSRELL